MENHLILVKSKPNIFEFSVEVEGIDTKDICVCFTIKTSDMFLSFEAKKEGDSKWIAKVPALSILEKTTYPYTIEATADGYYFEAIKGTISVVASTELYATEPKNVTLSAPKEEEKKEEKKEPIKERFFTKDEARAVAQKAVNAEIEKGDTRARDQIITSLLKGDVFTKNTIQEQTPVTIIPPVALKRIGEKKLTDEATLVVDSAPTPVTSETEKKVRTILTESSKPTKATSSTVLKKKKQVVH